MKVSIEWLNQYLDRPATASDVETLLARQGFPIEGTEQVGSDHVVDAEVTSNRNDCNSHVGFAREVAAGSGRTLKLPDTTLPTEQGESADKLTTVTNDRIDLCPLYTARIIRGVKVGKSPDWLVRRLQALGLRSVNNVVDVTNYVLMESGQPLHAFDMARLKDRRIVVRAASEGESFTAIDGTKHKLRGDMLVIADAHSPVAIAGVMGGLESEVCEKTTDIVLESAMFDQLSVRRTSRALKLSSDSSYRFERGVDPEGVLLASSRAAKLIIELAGGQLAPGVISAGRELRKPVTVTMRVARCNALTGLDLSMDQMVKHLAALHLNPKVDAAGEAITCTVPTFRGDIEREVDLIEEVARMHGLDAIQVERKVAIVARPMQDIVAARQTLARVFNAHGYHETITFSFVNPKAGEAFVPAGEQAVLIEDERRKSEPMLRPSLLPSLLACRKANQDVGNHDVRLYETASAWSRKDGKIIERKWLAMLCDAQEPQLALRDMRGTIEEAVMLLGGVNAQLTIESVQANNCLVAASVKLNGETLGTLGVFDRATQDRFDLQTSVAGAEIQVDALLAMYPPRRRVQPLSRFPGIERDLSVVVKEQVDWSRIEREVREARPALLEDVRFLVTYRGKQLAKGHKSVSFRMTFRDPAGTLRHDQVDPQVAGVVQKLTSTLGAELRT